MLSASSTHEHGFEKCLALISSLRTCLMLALVNPHVVTVQARHTANRLETALYRPYAWI